VVQDVSYKTRRFTTDEYDHLTEIGFLGEDDRVELLEGEIVEMPPMGNRHSSCIARLTRVLQPKLGDSALLWAQMPVRIDDRSKPEPDAALVRFDPNFYASGQPTAADVLLVIEVADSTLGYDRSRKGPVYARGGIPDYWLVDLNAERVEVFREPAGEHYQSVQVFRRGERISVLALPGLELTVDEILGPLSAG
jgi:Uma2 family endonuclease